jgi:Na+/alanine symporter
MIFAMVIPNMVGLYFLLPVVKKELAIFYKHVAEKERS